MSEAAPRAPAPDPPPLCERDLETEGPCYGPRFPREHAAHADRLTHGRRLCLNHVVSVFGEEEYLGPKDPTTKYRISPHGFYNGAVAVGQLAYVLFAPPKGEGTKEGMWVKVSHVGPDFVVGSLDNDPLDPDLLGVEYGDTVVFPASAIRRVQ